MSSSLLRKGGALANALPQFEEREEQLNLLEDVKRAFAEEKIALIEAGTGVGKSFGYLVPALLHAHQHQEKVVISTHTIPLQEQLVYKDLPLLIKALDLSLQVSLVLGMGNYLCKKKVEELDNGFRPLVDWGRETETGKKSDCKIPFYPQEWEELSVDPDSCTGKRCAHYEECFFFKERKKAENSQILVVNHHLLLTDLVAKREGDKGILPQYGRLIIDEAHHLEDVATHLFARRLSMKETYKTLNKVVTEGAKGRKGRLNVLVEAIETSFPQQIDPHFVSCHQMMRTEFPVKKRELMDHWAHFFHQFESFSHKWRLTKGKTENAFWQNQVLPQAKICRDEGRRFLADLQGVASVFTSFKDEEKVEPSLFELKALIGRIKGSLEILDQVIVDPKFPEKRVYWIAQDRANVEIVDAPLVVDEELKTTLFDPIKTSILLSATLTAHSGFGFIKSRLGITGEAIEAQYTSPFNYQEQSLFLVPNNLPLPDHPDFSAPASEVMFNAIQSTYGGTFILFTSYSSLETFYIKMEGRLTKNRYEIFKQGSGSRKALIEAFKKSKKGVLFGTDSFWEGVDIAGSALRLVILMKLPFQAPGEPLVEAKSEWIESEGKSPFWEMHLPKAVVKFKQGFGRLIRHRQDRGVVLCLDKRVLKKGYGKLFLKSLPDCEKLFPNLGEEKACIRKFWSVTESNR